MKHELTELEGCVLGMIGTTGPCTPYAIRRGFRESPSQYWSASAGAIYPLIVRLQRRRLIRLKRKTGDGREGKLYALTPAGESALRRWLGPPCPATAIGVPPDPLRNRVAFFAMLKSAERAAFLKDAIDGVARHLEEVQSYTQCQERQGQSDEYLVSLGAKLMLEARLAWLREMAHRLGVRTD